MQQCIDYSESGRIIIHGSDGVCYLVILFGRVILYVWCSPPVFSQSVCLPVCLSVCVSDEYLVNYTVISPPDVYRRVCVVLRSSHNLFKTLDLPSGEGVLTAIPLRVPRHLTRLFETASSASCVPDAPEGHHNGARERCTWRNLPDTTKLISSVN